MPTNDALLALGKAIGKSKAIATASVVIRNPAVIQISAGTERMLDMFFARNLLEGS